MQVHHGFDVNRVGAQAVNDGIRKTVEVEFAIFAPECEPAFRLGHDPPQRALKLVKKVSAKARLPLFVPKTRQLPIPRRPQDG